MAHGTPMTGWLTKALAVVALVVVLFGADSLTADPAAADGAGPTRFESIIDGVDPDLASVDVSIVGGDAFIQVDAERGTEVEIAGYDGEPYLRIEPDGTVRQNRRSPAAYLNMTRGGSQDRFPDDVSSKVDPEWVTVGAGGTVAWHDHRVHWMLEELPTTGTDGLVQAWEVPIEVDGEEVVVTGRLLIDDTIVPWPAAVAVLAAGAAFLIGRHRRGRLAVLAVASLAATATAVAAFSINPPRSGASVIPVALPVISVVLVTWWWLASRNRSRGMLDLALPLAAIAALFGWAVQRAGVFWMPTVPTAMPEWLDRTLTGMVLGAAVGTAIAVLLRPFPEPGPADQQPGAELPLDDPSGDQPSSDQASGDQDDLDQDDSDQAGVSSTGRSSGPQS